MVITTHADFNWHFSSYHVRFRAGDLLLHRNSGDWGGGLINPANNCSSVGSYGGVVSPTLIREGISAGISLRFQRFHSRAPTSLVPHLRLTLKLLRRDLVVLRVIHLTHCLVKAMNQKLNYKYYDTGTE